MKTWSSFTQLAVFWSLAFTSYSRPGTPTEAGWTALLLDAEGKLSNKMQGTGLSLCRLNIWNSQNCSKAHVAQLWSDRRQTKLMRPRRKEMLAAVVHRLWWKSSPLIFMKFNHMFWVFQKINFKNYCDNLSVLLQS